MNCFKMPLKNLKISIICFCILACFLAAIDCHLDSAGVSKKELAILEDDRQVQNYAKGFSKEWTSKLNSTLQLEDGAERFSLNLNDDVTLNKRKNKRNPRNGGHLDRVTFDSYKRGKHQNGRRNLDGDFIVTDVLEDGEREVRIKLGHIMAKEISAGRKGHGLVFRQLTDGSHFIQTISNMDDEILDCEYLKDKRTIRDFGNKFNLELSRSMVFMNGGSNQRRNHGMQGSTTNVKHLMDKDKEYQMDLLNIEDENVNPGSKKTRRRYLKNHEINKYKYDNKFTVDNRRASLKDNRNDEYIEAETKDSEVKIESHEPNKKDMQRDLLRAHAIKSKNHYDNRQSRNHGEGLREIVKESDYYTDFYNKGEWLDFDEGDWIDSEEFQDDTTDRSTRTQRSIQESLMNLNEASKLSETKRRYKDDKMDLDKVYELDSIFDHEPYPLRNGDFYKNVDPQAKYDDVFDHNDDFKLMHSRAINRRAKFLAGNKRKIDDSFNSLRNVTVSWLDKEFIPEGFKNWLKYDIMEKRCDAVHNTMKASLKESSTLVEATKAPSRRRRWISGLLPGTVWCGMGDDSKGVNSKLGPLRSVDQCCRQHDQCPDGVPAYSKKHAFTNPRPFTLSKCSCDRRFRTCLKLANTDAANMVGRLFFNVVQTKCFVLKPEKICLERSWWGKCMKLGYAKRAHLRDNQEY